MFILVVQVIHNFIPTKTMMNECRGSIEETGCRNLAGGNFFLVRRVGGCAFQHWHGHHQLYQESISILHVHTYDIAHRFRFLTGGLSKSKLLQIIQNPERRKKIP
ncbi:unnamed protein product [Amoebophrya sp. A120]|nr:unnamed protein product [Amoebophrya sp. A120]|eukprot:GSA120T00016677001.1